MSRIKTGDGSGKAITIVVMGVSGSGKTALGQRLARALGVSFEEGDRVHPERNVAKMRAGIPLDDEDRAPWLDAVAGWIGARRGRGGVVSCSALKRAYRDRLRRADPRLRFVFLAVDLPTLRARLERRKGHFMPASLLGSQLATLEPPSPAEPDVLVLAGADDLAELQAAILTWLGRDSVPAFRP